MRNTRKYMKRSKAALAVLLAVLTLFFCACANTIIPNGGAQQSGSASPESTVEPEKAIGGELFIAMPENIETFDPLAARTEDMANLLSLIYESPLAYEADGKLETELVSSYEVDASKTEFTFHLKRGVYFGGTSTEMTAGDIVYSANKVRALSGEYTPGEEEQTGDEGGQDESEDGQTGSEEAGWAYEDMSFRLMASTTPGESAGEETSDPEESPGESATDDQTGGDNSQGGEGETAPRYTQYAGYVGSIEATDDYTVILRMTKQGNAGLHFMTFPVMSEAHDSGSMPIGTGRYKVDSYEPDEQVALSVNEQHRDGTPYILRIVAKPIEDTEQKVEAVTSSLLDLITTDIRYTEKYKKPGRTQIIDYMTNYYDCIVPNLAVGQLRDANVRQAISYAINRRQLISTGLLNHAVPTNMPIASDYYAYDSKYKVNDYDINKARELLLESGYRTSEKGEGAMLSLNMIVPDNRESSYRKETAKSIKKQLLEVGIEINLEILSEEDYMVRLEAGNFALAYCSFYMDIAPDLSFMLSEGGSGNYGNISSDDINTTLAACALAITEEETTSAYSELQRVFTERMPHIGLFYRMNSIICDEGIKGITGARQNMIFSKIEEWSIGYTPSSTGTEPTPEPEPTPEEGAADIEENEKQGGE